MSRNLLQTWTQLTIFFLKSTLLEIGADESVLTMNTCALCAVIPVWTTYEQHHVHQYWSICNVYRYFDNAQKMSK